MSVRKQNKGKTYEIQQFHCSIHFAHNIVRFALRPNAQMPLGALGWCCLCVATATAADSAQVSKAFGDRATWHTLAGGLLGLIAKRRRTRAKAKVLQVELGRLIFDALVVHNQMVRDRQLIMWIAIHQGIVHILVRSTKFLSIER